jgi:phosphoribosyl-ATP pyrophosphohydrolase
MNDRTPAPPLVDDPLDRLYAVVAELATQDPDGSRTSRLFRAGRSKIAKKVAEEAVEVAIDAVAGRREAMIRESADLIYNLVVLWVDAGITLDDVWSEMERRERHLGIAEKWPKHRPTSTTPGETPAEAIAPLKRL